jgi:hypothetical protein
LALHQLDKLIIHFTVVIRKRGREKSEKERKREREKSEKERKREREKERKRVME